MSNNVAGFIGVGAIAEHMIKGFLTSPQKVFDKIYVSPRNADRVADLAKAWNNVIVCSSNQEVLDKSFGGYIFICVRHQDFQEVVPPLKFSASHKIISVVATKSQKDLIPVVSPATEIVLAIPLPPIEKRVGPVVLFPPNEKVKELFSNVGTPVEVTSLEEMRALVTSTCMMAPFYAILSKMIAWTKDKGVEPKTAGIFITSLITALMLDAKLAAKDGDCLARLVKECQTPGGINEMSLGKLLRTNFFNDLGSVMDTILGRLEGKEVKIEPTTAVVSEEAGGLVIQMKEDAPSKSTVPHWCQYLSVLGVGVGLGVLLGIGFARRPL